MDIDLTGGRGGTPGMPPGMPPGMGPRRQASPLRIIMSILGSVGMLPIFFVVFAGAPSCMGFEEPTLRLIEACPPAAAALGTPVARSWIGMSCGNAEENGAFGNASWTFPVSGPNGRGSVNVVAMRRGGPWVVSSATVETSAGTFEAVSCAAGAGVSAVGAAMPPGFPTPMPGIPGMPPPAPPGAPGVPPGLGALGGIPGLSPGAPVHVTATVETATPGAPAATGESCSIDVTPAAFGAPCALSITCAGRPVYTSGAVSHATCLPGGRGGTTALDTSDTDGDPIVTVTSESGSATMTSTTGSVWAVSFTFPPTP